MEEIQSLENKFINKLEKETDYHSMSHFIVSRIISSIKLFKNEILSSESISVAKDRFYNLKKHFNDRLKTIPENDVDKRSELKENSGKEVLKFCWDYKVDIVNVINDLIEVFNLLMRSSGRMDKFFKIPLLLLARDMGKTITVTYIQVEEFHNVLINDSFIKVFNS
jgi:hypothetical protein